MTKKNKDIAYIYDKTNNSIYKMPKIKKVGLVKSFEEYCYREHTHIDNEWVYINKGSLDFYINGKKYNCKSGDFYYIQPTQLHREDCHDKDMEFYYIIFYYLDLSGQAQLINNNLANTQDQIIRSIDKDFVKIFFDIINESKNTKPGSKQVMEALLLYLVWFLKRKYEQKKDLSKNSIDTKIEYVHSAIKYINNNLNYNLKITDIASFLNISSNYLTHIFKNITGVSPSKYILNAKIDKARFLLKSTDMQIGEISDELSFYDQSNFTKHFKKITGVLPKDYS